MAPQWHIREPWTAPAYICETLRSKGYRVQFIDWNVRLYRLSEKLGFGHLWHGFSFHQAWQEGEMRYLAYLCDIEEIKGAVIGFSVTQQSVYASIELAKRIRKRYPNRKIIFGGHEVFFPEQVAVVPLDAADAICKGEGEATICELMERGVENAADVPGLYVPTEEGWRNTGHRCPIQDLDTIPWPTFSEIDYDLYGKRFLPIMGSRGCIGNCFFCGDRYTAPGYRIRSALNQVDELEYLSTNFDVEHFPYNDPLLDGNIPILEEKTDELIRRKLDVSYGGNMMVRRHMPESLFPKLRQSGMTIALVGVESGSADVLRRMRKQHTPEQASWFLRNLHNAGIRTEVNFLFGFPTETEAHFQETLQFLRDNRQYMTCVISIASLILLPSDLADQRDEFNVVMNEETGTKGWYVADGSNTLEIREDRVNRFMAAAREYGLIEDYLMGDHHVQESKGLPTARAYWKKYVAHWQDNPTCTQDERSTALRIGKDLEDALALFGPKDVPLSPVLLAQKALSSLRRYGIRGAIERGRQWYQIRRS